MANQYQVSATQLTPNTTVLIKGTLTYSRLAKLVEGEELAKVDAKRAANGMNPIGKPHTSVNLANADVVFKNPNSPTMEEQFVHERRFNSDKHPEHGISYGMENKSSRLPIVGVQQADGTTRQVILEGDLAAGIEATLVLRVYKPKGYANCGLSLDMVILHEEPRYYNAGVNVSELADRGIIFTTPPVQAAAPAAAPAAAAAYLPAGTDPNTGLPAPAPAVAAVPATLPVMAPAPVVQPAPATVAPAAVAPVAAAPVAQPAPAAQPVPQFETPAQELERLRAAEAARVQAAAASGGASAFGESPWVEPQAPVGAQQGIAYSG